MRNQKRLFLKMSKMFLKDGLYIIERWITSYLLDELRDFKNCVIKDELHNQKTAFLR